MWIAIVFGDDARLLQARAKVESGAKARFRNNLGTKLPAHVPQTDGSVNQSQ
jgi:hypothetical protein